MAKNIDPQEIHQQGMKIAHLNIKGFTSKMNQINKILFTSKIDIFGLTETFLDDTKPSSFFHINNYNLIRKGRVTGQGGGVLYYFRNDIPFQEISPLNPIIPESITLKITQTNTQPFIICFLYRPPSTLIDWNRVFSQHVQQCSTLCQEIIILGNLRHSLNQSMKR